MSAGKWTRRSLGETLTRARVLAWVVAFVISIPLGLFVWHLMRLDDVVGWLFVGFALVMALRFLLWILLPVAGDVSKSDELHDESVSE
jgi:hypothetical protein